MSSLEAPPPRPSTARLTAPPMAVLRDLPRPRVVAVSLWCWVVASLAAAAAVALQSTKIEPMRVEFARVARTSDANAAQATIDRVAGVSVLLVLGAGAILGTLGLLLAGAMRTGRNWARLVLFLLTPVALVYGAFLATALTEPMLGDLRSAVSLMLLAYTAAVTVAAVCLFLPGTRAWFHRPAQNRR